MLKLSVIVPVYKVEKYVGKCIHSLLSQNTNDYEIIVVNDGSPDKSIEIIRRNFNDPKIRIIEQENQGLSAARNKGLENAKGEYVWFIDSDDYIEENCLQDVFSKLKDKDLLVFMNGILEKENEKSLSYNGTYNPQSYTKKELLKNFIACAPYYIYRKDFLYNSHLFFKNNVLHEDMEFTPRVLFKATSFVYYEKPLYHQSVRENSITHTFNPKRLSDVLGNAESIFSFYKDNKSESCSGMLLLSAGKCIIYGIILSNKLSYEERIKYINRIANDKLLIGILLKSPALRHKLQGFLLKASPFIYIKVFDFLFSIKQTK